MARAHAVLALAELAEQVVGDGPVATLGLACELVRESPRRRVGVDVTVAPQAAQEHDCHGGVIGPPPRAVGDLSPIATASPIVAEHVGAAERVAHGQTVHRSACQLEPFGGLGHQTPSSQ